MSFMDDVPDSAGMLPFFGGAGILLFLIIVGFAYCSHKDVMAVGEWGEVTAIGTCRDGSCAIKVMTLESEQEIHRTTGSKIFVGDKVKCGSDTCFKD